MEEMNRGAVDGNGTSGTTDVAAPPPGREATGEMRRARQARRFRTDPVPAETLAELLEVARWTGSSLNTQPWQFVVVTDREQLRRLSQVRPPIGWVAGAPLAIALVLDGANPISEAYDEGRVSERLLVAARFLGLGGGIAWFGDAAQQAHAKRILGVPAERTTRSLVAIGYPVPADRRPIPVTPGRKPLSRIVSRNRLGESAEVPIEEG